MREPIDFSCKHDILIRHKDGSLTPMDEPYYEVTPIAPHAWKIMSSGDYHYLLEGDDEGIAIDTGYGAGNLREFLESIIHKPVRCVINTHYHFDHSATVIAAAITGHIKGRHQPTHVHIRGTARGLSQDSTILLEQLRTLDKSRLGEYIGHAGKNKMKEVDAALNVSIGLTQPHH